VVDRLRSLGATVTICARDPDSTGDPSYHRFSAAVRAGAIPFGCQGPDNGLTIEGGATLAWEIAEVLAGKGVAPSRMMVQVGGGALGSACIQGMREAVALGVLPRLPVIDAVQTMGAYPLARAFDALTARIHESATAEAALDFAAHHRSRFMRAWESVPASVASGILDDETYDWLAIVGGLVETGGSVAVVDEAILMEANDLGRRTTGIDVDHTGTAGLAALLHLARSGTPPAGSDIVVIFSGARR
jgi:threonine synthase